MTKMTKNGMSTTTVAAQEQYETFTIRIGRKSLKRMQYDYRHTNGQLFSCVCGNLEKCRSERNKWLVQQTNMEG